MVTKENPISFTNEGQEIPELSKIQEAMRVFDAFISDRYPAEELSGNFRIMRVESERPLFVVYPEELDGAVAVDRDNSMNTRIVIKTSDKPGQSSSVVAEFDYNVINRIEWYLNGIWYRQFRAPKYTNPDGTGAWCEGYIAAIQKGQMMKERGIGLAKYYVVFAGFDGKSLGTPNAWHGCVILGSVKQ